MIIVGHRGARNEAPENTVEGFVHAQQQGCQYFELDIQLSADHELVVFHDTSLKRTTGKRGKLIHQPYSHLKTLDASVNTPNWHHCNIPNLQKVVNATPHTLHWQFEVKTDSRQRLKILTQHLYHFIIENNLRDKVTVTSSNRWFLAHIKNLHPELSTGYVAEYRFHDPVKTAQKLACDMLAMSVSLASERTVKSAKQAALNVSCWTVNDLPKMEVLKGYGVDSIITDLPTMALEHFSKR